MEEILITEEELDYLINVPQTVAEDAVYMNSKMTVEEAIKKYNAITLDEFAEMWDESIRRLMPDP